MAAMFWGQFLFFWPESRLWQPHTMSLAALDSTPVLSLLRDIRVGVLNIKIL